MFRTVISEKREDVVAHRDQIAELLLDFAPAQHVAWKTRPEALADIDESLTDDKPRISLVALSDRNVVGWVAGFQTYSHAYEIHPIVVRADMQRRGVGSRLLEAFEAAAARCGATTVYLGSDDVKCATTLGGCDLFPGVLEKTQSIANLKGHPYEFYVRCGYEIVGVLPDVNGIGKPDIWLAKSLRTVKHVDRSTQAGKQQHNET